MLFRSALAPQLTGAALALGTIVTGAFFVEAVFSYPGLGWLFVHAIERYDFPTVRGVMLLLVLSVALLTMAIDLAVPLLDRLRHDLGVEPALLHGALSDGERADEWRRIRAAAAPVVVGTRTAILAPVADPGIVIVDEEHDASYKSDRTPRFQARDVALLLDRKSTRLNSSHIPLSRMPSSA